MASMGADRDAVMAYWREHPHLSDRQVNEHFGEVFNRNTLRTWKRTYIAGAVVAAASPQEIVPINGRNAPEQVPLPMGPRAPGVERAHAKDLAELGLTEEEVASADMLREYGLTVARKDRIVKLLRSGIPQGIAARRVGITELTYYRWRTKGRTDTEGIHHDFWVETEQAMAEAEARLVGYIRRAAKHDWRAALKLLERRWPQRWREQKLVEHQGNEPQPGATLVVQVQALAVSLASMSPDQLAALSSRDVIDVEPGTPDSE